MEEKTLVKLICIIELLFLFLALIFSDPIIHFFKIDSLSNPQFGSYRSDELSFLKTFYLMKEGKDYYQAFLRARAGLIHPDILTQDTFTWRMPTLFYLWDFFAQSGQQIFTFYLFMLLNFLFSLFLMIKKMSNLVIGFFSIVVVLPYVFDTFSYKTAFLFPEWWALFFFVIGCTFLFYGLKKNAIFFLSLAPLIRELFIVPILLCFFLTWVTKKDKSYFIFPLTIFFLVYGLHYFLIHTQFKLVKSSETLFQRIHLFSIKNLQLMIAFSMRKYIYFNLKTNYLFFLLGVCSALWQLIKTKSVYISSFFISIVVFILVLPMISVQDNDYWGIVFMPMLLSTIPLLLYGTQKKEL